MTVSVYDPVPDIGYLYDHVPLYASREDVRFYVDEAARAGGPVLELGCGTGRVLLPTARAGVAVTGLDGSRLLLERLRGKLPEEAPEVRERVSLVEGDARYFELRRTFALVTAPFRVMQHIVSVADQVALMESAARHLEPGGRFIFDLFNPRYDLLLKDRSAMSVDTPELTMADGRTLERGVRIPRVRWLDQVIEVEMIWRVADRPGAAVREFVQPFEMRWFTRSEVEHLAARAGLVVEAVYGDWQRGPLVDGAPEQVWVLSLPGQGR